MAPAACLDHTPSSYMSGSFPPCLTARILQCSDNFQTPFKGDMIMFSHFLFIIITSSFNWKVR